MAAGRCLSTSKNIIALLNTRSMASGQEKKVAAVVLAEKEEPSWVPDSVTGYYRPEDKGEEIDAADMRKNLLSKNVDKPKNMD